MPWIYLTIAIVCETIGTTALKATNGFSHLGFTIFSLLSYSIAFYFLAMVLKTMPVGVAYAIWSGAGVALVTLIGQAARYGHLGVVLHKFIHVAVNIVAVMRGVGISVRGIAVIHLLIHHRAHALA